MPSLPNNNSDSGVWGTELNTWLQYSHNADGTHPQILNNYLGAQRYSKLLPWYAALAGRNNSRVDIAIIGDSITAGYKASSWETTYPQVLAKRLRTMFPANGGTTGGRGFCPPIIPPSGASLYSPDYVTLSGSGAASLASTNLFAYGPNLCTWNIAANGGTTLTYHLTGDSASILWGGAPGNGTFSWKVDSGSTTNVSTNVTLGMGYVTHVSLGTAGSHTLTIAPVSGSSIYISGIVEFNGDYTSGIQVHNLGFSGATTAFWGYTPVTTYLTPQAVSALDPDLLIIELGPNDPVNGISPATSYSNMLQVITNMRSAFTIPILLVFDYNAYGDGPTTAATWNTYSPYWYEIAANDSAIDILDLNIRMPSSQTSEYGLYDSDQMHPTDAGNELIAEILTSFLSPA